MLDPTADKLLFTPGPLTTSATVKAAMQRDLGSRDTEFMHIVKAIRARLLILANAAADQYASVIMQGSGTFGVEAVISSTLPPNGTLLVIVNGAYGERMVQIANAHKIAVKTLRYDENVLPSLTDIDAALRADLAIHTVAVVHCETTTGLINPIESIGAIVATHGRRYFVDAMSSFGAVPIDVGASPIDYLISSSNKCIEGVPGFSFVIAGRDALHASAGYARTVSLDLLAQWQELERSGQFRYTPPIQPLLAFDQALRELDAEGGVAGRAARYQANHATLLAGMRALGFRPYLAPDQQSYIITTFYYPDHPNFVFSAFYEHLNAKGCVIYPGKLGTTDCFRIGNIGRLFPTDMERLLDVVRATLAEMHIELTASEGQTA